MGKSVDEYIAGQKSPQKEICAALRNIILKAYPGINEEMKLGVPYYEDRYYIVALKNHVNLGFSIERLSEKEISLFDGGGKTTKHLKVFSPEDIDEQRIINLLELVKNKNK